MNTGCFAGAVIGVWIVRVALNATFYTQIVGQQFEQMSSAHPGMLRTVIPAYIVTDLIFACFYLPVCRGRRCIGRRDKGGRDTGRNRSDTFSCSREPVPVLQRNLPTCWLGFNGFDLPRDCSYNRRRSRRIDL